MQNFENFLQQHLPVSKSVHPHYEVALHQMLLAGGKRFRPALLLSVVEAYEPLLIGGAMHVAYAIELLHTYSLIHDDLPAMDNASLRRGKPTLHKSFDETTAILVGDALNTYAFEVLANAPFSDVTKVALIKELSYNGGLNGMVLGQAIDCHFENRPLNLDDVKFLHTHKTAKLIAASLKMGAIIVDNETLADELYRFGLDLGLLFQIQDDILDATQSEAEAQKTTNNDSNKNSFVTLLGVEDALHEANKLSGELNSKIDSFDTLLKEKLGKLLKDYINRHKR